jgi:hypothetical protein
MDWDNSFECFFCQVQATMNNISVSSPVEDIMPSLLRMCDKKEVSKYNLLTVSYSDQNFSTLKGCENYSSNPLAGMQEVSYNANIMPRGVFFPKSIIIEQRNAAGVVVRHTPFCATAGNTFKISISVPLNEPLLFLSPFAGLVKYQDDASLLGINKMNIICNIRFNLGGLFKTSNTYNYTVSLGFNGNDVFF